MAIPPGMLAHLRGAVVPAGRRKVEMVPTAQYYPGVIDS